MERTISPEERIRRAEEIYQRRRLDNSSVRMSSSQVRDGREKRQITLYKKLIVQVLICILIYLIFSLIKEANYIFSDNVLDKTHAFLSTDINFEAITSQASQFFQDNQDKLNFLSSWLKENNHQDTQNEVSNEQNSKNEAEDKEKDKTENETESKSDNKTGDKTENKTEDKTENKTEDKSENKKEDKAGQNTTVTNNLEEKDNNTVENTAKNNGAVGIGGEESNEVTVATSSNSNSSKKTQMQLDAEYIKKNFSLQLPVKGAITSHYGEREATEIVSANHQGIDIGVNEGTTIVAAMEGKVSLVSKEGEYGTHVKIVNKDITTIYAHCSKILVKEGANIKKGQKIALSGNTGRTTGPHLHFEIRRDNRTIDPELLLSWK